VKIEDETKFATVDLNIIEKNFTFMDAVCKIYVTFFFFFQTTILIIKMTKFTNDSDPIDENKGQH